MLAKIMISHLVAGALALTAGGARTAPPRMSASAAGLLMSPESAGIRRQLANAGAPVPIGAVEAPDQGWWDGTQLGSCVVRRFTDEMRGDRWMMWYTARPSDLTPGVMPVATGAIGLAQSTDGITWERLAGDGPAGECFGPNDEDWWTFDTTHVGLGDVHVMSNQVVKNSLGLYWMYYFGGDANDYEMTPGAPPVVGAATSIGVALSNDGVHWGRVEGEHSSGAVLEPTDDQLFVGWPQCVQMSSEPDLWHMYYHAFDKKSESFSIGVATSSNCVNWKPRDGYCLEPSKDAAAFDAGGVSARCVIADPALPRSSPEGPKAGGWLMFYEAQDAEKRHTIGLARSTDGLEWRRDSQTPVLEPSAIDGSWDEVAVSRPWVVPMDDGSARIYYIGRGANGEQAIGMAQSDGNDWSKFTRIAPVTTK